MRVYLIKDADIDRLFAQLDRDPTHGMVAGSAQVLTQQEREAHAQAHRFYNFQLRQWINDIVKGT